MELNELNTTLVKNITSERLIKTPLNHVDLYDAANKENILDQKLTEKGAFTARNKKLHAFLKESWCSKFGRCAD